MESKRIIALGFFDGVHVGHGALLDTCREMAQAMGARAAAVTFSTHPDALVSGKAPGLINSIYDREMLMRTLYRMDEVITLPFDKETMSMSWQTFFHMLRQKYGAAGLVCGHDFRFGKHGEGNGEKLAAICAEYGLVCRIVPEQKINGITVSSTHIRSLLEQGDMEQAALFLGHPHIISGIVVPGKHLGRTLGVPTANLVLPEALVRPRQGVYACKAEVAGMTCLAVTNLGTRPTVGGENLTVEPWLLDFEGDLYGKRLTLSFYRFLRPERKFSSLEELREEIQKNAAQTRKFFEK